MAPSPRNGVPNICEHHASLINGVSCIYQDSKYDLRKQPSEIQNNQNKENITLKNVQKTVCVNGYLFAVSELTLGQKMRRHIERRRSFNQQKQLGRA